jgi:hypothetical protein
MNVRKEINNEPVEFSETSSNPGNAVEGSSERVGRAKRGGFY